MGYVTRYDYDEDTGRKIAYRVWVPDPPKPKAKPKPRRASRAALEARRRAAAAAAAAKAQAAARAAAQRASVRRAADERAQLMKERRDAQAAVAAGRREAVERVSIRARELVRSRGLVKDPPKRNPPAPKPVGRSVQSLREQYEDRAQARQAAYRATRRPELLKGEADEANTGQRLATVREIQRRQVNQRALSTQATLGDIDRALANEAARARRGQIDGQTVGKLAEKYVALAERTAAGYKAMVDKINEAIDAGNVARARQLYSDPRFQAAAAEYARLFGSGDDPGQEGAFNAFWRQYGEIENAQSEWWKRQVNAALESDKRTVEQKLAEARAAGDMDLVRELEALSKVYSGSTGRVVDHYEMWKDARGEEHYRPIYRTRTVQEELEHREAARRIEMERLRAQFQSQQKYLERMARKEGLVEGPAGQYMLPGQASAAERMMRMIEERGGTAPTIKRAEDLTRWIDEVLLDWERDNPRPKSRRTTLEESQKWQLARREFERELYEFYDATPPGLLERAFSIPGVSHALSLLQGGVSSIGGAARVVNAWRFGTSNVGGDQPDWNDLPPHVKDAWKKDKDAVTKFLETDAGKRWLRWATEESRKRGEREGLEFLEGFYGQADPGLKLEALNKFGSEPFAQGEPNLLFQLLADPTNAIPLKFTTYLARAKYAAELSGKTKFLGSNTLGRARDFVKVDEGALRLRSELNKVLSAAKVEGRSVRQLTEDLLADVAGITEKSARDKAIRQKLVALGIAPRLIDDSQVFTLIEEAIKRRLKTSGVDYRSQAVEESVKRAEAEEAARLAAEGRIKGQSASRIKAQARRDAEIKSAQAKRERIAGLQGEAAAHEADLAAAKARQKEAAVAKAQAEAPVVRVVPAVERKVAPKVKARRVARGQGEYYKPDAFGNLLPVGSKVAKDPRYQATVKAAKEGDLGARALLARYARLRRNQFRTAGEDVASGSPYRPTELDFLEAAGVAGADDATKAAIIADREQIRALVRKAGHKNADASLADEKFSVLGADGRPLRIGEDLIAVRELTGNKLKGVYETFSGMPGRSRRYKGGLFDRVRDRKWRAKHLGPARFRKILDDLDEGELIGVGGFRDGGQALFELFHSLRLEGNTAKLQRLSAVVDDLISDDDLLGSVFAWQWKVMEERAGLPWALDAEIVEAGFMEAARAFDLHPNLALSMIPNGFYAHAHGPRFRVSRALLSFADGPYFKMAPVDWTDTQVLRTVSELFARDTEGSAARVLDYVASRYGSFGRANRVRHRIFGELARRSVGDFGADEVAARLMPHMPRETLARIGETIEGKTVQDAIANILARRKTFRGSGGLMSLELDKYPEVEAAVEAAYWAGDLPHLSGEGHKLMLLMHLQENPGRWLSETHQVVDYLLPSMGLSDTKAFVSAVFERRVSALPARAATELLDRTAPLTREWELWRKLGMIPDEERIHAWLANRGRAFEEGKLLDTLAAQEGIHLPGERSLDRFADNTEDQVERDLLASHDRDVTGTPFVDVNDVDGLRSRLYAVLNRASKEEEPGKWAQSAVEELSRVARFMMEGSTAVDFDELRDLVQALAHGKFGPTIESLLDDVRDAIGIELTARWLNAIELSPDQLRLVDPRKPDWRGRKGGRLFGQGRSNLDKKIALENPVEEIPASATSDIARAQGVFGTISRMSEEEWWNYLSQKMNGRLRNPQASAKTKAHARATLDDIAKARWVKRVLEGKGNHAGPAAREKARNAVVSQYGKDAEELIRPNSVAPYVEDAQGLAVERSRQYWRRLRGAPGTVSGGVRRLGAQDARDHFPVELFDEIDAEISREASRARGFHAQYLTGKRGRGKKDVDEAVRYRDTDPLIQDIKRRVMAKRGIDVAAYDEARGVLRWGLVQQRTAARIMRVSEWLAKRTGEDYKTVYLRLRERAAKRDARQHLGWLAADEMFGVEPALVFEEFVARWADDGQLRRTIPPLTQFQRRTLEGAVRSISGVDEIGDIATMRGWLQSRNKPPMTSRADTRQFLVDIGAWSPRRAEQFVLGDKSWSIDEEAEYWFTSYGEVPPWADRDLLGSSEPGFEAIFHDQDLYYAQMRAWGVFDRDAEIRLRLSGKSSAEIEEAFITGNEALGVNARRELEIQRRYVIERYGSLVADEHGRLIAMPWLMYEDEVRRYFARQSTSGLAESLVQNAEELDELERMIDEAITEFWDEYIAPAAADGPVKFEHVFKMGSQIQARLLAHPKWARRYRDFVGDGLGVWASANRALVFTQFSFAVANVVDSPIKGAWYRLTRRGLFNRSLAGVPQSVVERISAWTPADLGLDVQTSLYRFKQRPVKDYFLSPAHKGLAGVLERASAFPRAAYRIPPFVAAKAELGMKMQLARGMGPQVYAEALAKLGDPDLADAFARKFVKDEIERMWPTVGDGPFEKLFNEFVPFASYMLRNKVLFISEAISHPAILNRIEFIGRYIEAENRRRWDEEHPDEPLPDYLARRIELPWAPGYFLDLSQFADATRGLKPIFNATEPMNPVDFMAQFIRLINPGTQAGLYMLTNALGVTKRIQWEPIVNSEGFVTGYRRVVTGWTEPWSNEQPTWASVFWVIDAMEEAQKLGAGGWTNGEFSQFLGKILTFGAVSTPDRGTALYEYYKTLREKDLEMAKRWLAETESGEYLQEWLLARATSLRDIADRFSLIARWDADPKRWFHTRDEKFQAAVAAGYERISVIRESYEARLFDMTPGTAEYRALQAEMFLAISAVYRTTPELMIYEVYSKSAAEWSKELQRWQVDKLIDEFFALDAQRPNRSDYKDLAAYRAARDAWEHQKEVFLQTYPQVREQLGSVRTEYQRVQRQVEAEWDRVLDRIAERGEAIEAAKAAGNSARADLLYLAQDLDFSILEQDRVALTFTDEDYQQLPSGSRMLRDGALKTAQTLLDFDRRRYEKAKREGRGQAFLDDLFYSQGLRDVILKAKGGDPFGTFNPGTFVEELRKRPRLLKLYFAKNPGKQEQWAQTDEYIRQIGRWGRAARAGDWDTAERIWSSLPQWVKDRYYAKHPERRQKAAQSAEYVGWLTRWTKFFEKDDAKGGMQFFWAMPKWVRERYFDAHPDKRVQYEGQLRFGAQLAEYFASSDENRAAYLASHPELKAWLIKHVGKEELRRQAIIVAYRAIPSDQAWLRRVYREKYPEIFSEEAEGKRKLKKVYDRLGRHPEMLPAFEKWLEAIFASYQEMLKHPVARPKPLTLDRSLARRSGSRSAADVSGG